MNERRRNTDRRTFPRPHAGPERRSADDRRFNRHRNPRLAAFRLESCGRGRNVDLKV